MKKKLLIKSIVLVVIVLLIGVGYSSAFSVDPNPTIYKKQAVNKLNYQQISNKNLVKIDRLSNRLSVCSKGIMLLSNDNPDLIEKWEEASINILDLKNSDRLICDVLGSIYISLKGVYINLKEMYNQTVSENLLKALLIGILSIFVAEMFLMAWLMGYELNCWDNPPM